MLKRILLSTGAGALLALSACDPPSLAGGVCDNVRNRTANFRGDTIVTTSGLRYIDLQLGSGLPVRSCLPVLAAYVVRLQDGTVVHEMREEFIPGVRRRIAGLEQGVIGMREHGIRRLIIPPELGQGGTAVVDPTGKVVIPANSTLIIDVEVDAAG